MSMRRIQLLVDDAIDDAITAIAKDRYEGNWNLAARTVLRDALGIREGEMSLGFCGVKPNYQPCGRPIVAAPPGIGGLRVCELGHWQAKRVTLPEPPEGINIEDFFAPAPPELDTKLVGSRPLDHFHPGATSPSEEDVRPERGQDPFATH